MWERRSEINKRRLNRNGQNAEQRNEVKRNADKQIVRAKKRLFFKTRHLKNTHTYAVGFKKVHVGNLCFGTQFQTEDKQE